MSEIGNLTLYREKSTVHRFAELGEGEPDEPVLEIRSNRITIPMNVGNDTHSCVVRAQNIPAALRLTGILVDEFRRDPGMIHEAADLDWDSRWIRRISTYENEYNPDLWVTVHIDGEPVYSTGEETMDVVHEIESLAAGGEVNESIIMEASSNIVGALEDLVVEHDSQTAFVFTPFAAYHRAAILERKGGKTGSFAISVYHPTPKKQVRLSFFMGYSADVMEALTMKIFMERVQQMVDDNTIETTTITPTQVAAARNRRRDLLQQIAGFEKAHKVTYRPERPSFN